MKLIQDWILKQILCQGELLRHMEAQLLILLCLGTAEGKFFLSQIQNFAKVSSTILSTRKYVFSLLVCTAVIY